MKNVFPVLIFVILFSCSDNKEKNKPDTKEKEQISIPASESASKDNTIKEWLLGKEWKAESEAAPFSILKVFSKDSCGYATGKYHYTFKNGRFEMFGAQWPFTRVNYTTFTIYVEPTKKTYTYQFVRNL